MRDWEKEIYNLLTSDKDLLDLLGYEKGKTDKKIYYNRPNTDISNKVPCLIYETYSITDAVWDKQNLIEDKCVLDIHIWAKKNTTAINQKIFEILENSKYIYFIENITEVVELDGIYHRYIRIMLY